MALWRHSIYLTLAQNKPLWFFKCFPVLDHYCLTVTDELYIYAPVFLCELNPIKAHCERGSRPFSSERLVSLSSPSRSVLVDLFSSAADRGLRGTELPPSPRPVFLVYT